jgi:hypothetical protein
VFVEQDLAAQMGHFGGPHEDLHDFVAGYSCAYCLSDLPDKPGCEPGRLHFLGLGAWVSLDYMLQLFFSGLLRHGGTAPLVPDDYKIEGWEARLLLISYPSAGILAGRARRSFSCLPYQQYPLYLTPEMTGAPVEPRDIPMWTTHGTYARDGWVGLDAKSHFNFMARGALQMLHFAFRQLPPSYKIEIDANIFLQSFSMLLDDDRVSAEDWELAPDSDVQQPYSERHKQVQDAFLVDLYNHLLPGIPIVQENMFENWSIVERELGVRKKSTIIPIFEYALFIDCC